MLIFWFKFHWCIPGGSISNKVKLVLVSYWCPIGNNLNQCWLRCLTSYDVTKCLVILFIFPYDNVHKSPGWYLCDTEPLFGCQRWMTCGDIIYPTKYSHCRGYPWFTWKAFHWYTTKIHDADTSPLSNDGAAFICSKTVVSPVRKQWRYCSLALSDWYGVSFLKIQLVMYVLPCCSVTII